jgi:transcriptional regulator with XRE-family HTH domain
MSAAKRKKPDSARAAWKRQRRFDREMLRSAFKSLFWGVMDDKRKKNDFTMSDLALATKTDKGRVSRWFKGYPNWQIDTIADIADALEIDLIVKARDRATGRIFAEYGLETPVRATFYDGTSETRRHPLSRSTSSETKLNMSSQNDDLRTAAIA